MKNNKNNPLLQPALLAAGIANFIAITTPAAHAAVEFLGVAAGDASSTNATLWTRAVDASAPANTALTIQLTTDPTFATGVTTLSGTTDSTKDYTCKVDITDLTPNTQYYYRFLGPTLEVSIIGKVKTAPLPYTKAPLHFAFSGDIDGLMRPYALASVIPAENLDFYINLGDVIYENASNLTGSGAHNGAPWLNSPSVTLSNSSLSLNAEPVAGTTFATQAQLQADYSKKYRENFLAVNTGGQNCLQVFYAAQGNFTTWDNHELGNRKYIDGGAPAGGSVGGAAGIDMPTGRGVDARNNGSGNVGNINDVNTSATDIMNKSTGFQTLRDVFLNYQPIADRGTVIAPTDARTHGSKRLYNAQQWGKNAVYINTDARSYRDIRLKTATAGADDTTAPRANNAARTYLGATQLAWVKQTLLEAQKAGTPWKFISISDPIDQLGPIGGALTGTLTSVNADGGKAYMGGYRAERNDLLKFIADNKIINVVFVATDDHQNRINELAYSPTGQTEVQSSYVKVPYCFSIVCGPLGATGPDTITDHSFTNIKAIADSLANAQTTAGIEPVGLQGYPGLKNLVRVGDPAAASSPQAVDFYSPDTFNYTSFNVSADGKTVSVRSVGMNATAQNSGIEYSAGPAASTIFSFDIEAATNGLITGPSTVSTPYVQPTLAGFETTSVLTVDNTGTTPDDLVPKVGGGSYGMVGIPDGLGSFDNGDGTFTLLMNQELGNTAGIVRDHGSKGAFVAKYVINKNTLAVVSGEDLIKQVFGWNATTQASNTVASTFAFNRFCSADLPKVSAFFNATSSLGTQERIFMHGEEGGATGYIQGTIVTGPDAGKSYTLGKFNLATNGSGVSAVGASENALANPYPQDKTIVISNNDGGTTGIANNAVAVYVGTKQATGTEVEKAGLMNGTLKFINVTGNAAEIVNSTTRATNIVNGTRFTLSTSASTAFSRPEDGAWDPLNPSYYYFATTDRLDQVSDGTGTNVGQTRLWRLTFDDITNPDLGGRIDLFIDGRTVDGEKVNMFDNITINETSGHILLQEDVGGAAHNGKVWDFDPATNVLKKVLKHDVARFGDVTTAVTAPFNNDEETSGIIDITSIMSASSLHKGNPREAWYISSDQAHYTSGITAAQAEGGQLFTVHDIQPVNNLAVARGGVVRDRSTGKYVQKVTITNTSAGVLTGPFHLALDGLSTNAALFNASGTTTVYVPLTSSFIRVPGSSLAPGASASVNLQFTNSNNGAITYTSRVLNSIVTP